MITPPSLQEASPAVIPFTDWYRFWSDGYPPLLVITISAGIAFTEDKERINSYPSLWASTQSPATALMISFLLSMITFRMNCKFAFRAAYNISLWIGFSSILPVRECSLSINSAQWLANTVTLEATPGNTDLRPPEKPAKKWGLISPSEMSNSVSTAKRLMTHLPPDGNVPISTIFSASSESWLISFSLFTISSPNRCTISSCVMARWNPVAIRIVISIVGFTARIRRSKIGNVTLLGIGRVWSLVMITILRFPLTNSSRGRLLIGWSRASSTSSAGLFSATYAAALDTRAPCTNRSSIDTSTLL